MNIISEQQALDMQLAGLHQRTPYAIGEVSHGQLSVARHYGGCVFKSEKYSYFAESDELVRDDVLAYIRKRAKAQRLNDKAMQQELI